MVAQGGVIDLRLLRRDPEGGGLAHGMGALAGCDQRFRRHATGIEAITAHGAALDQHHRHTEGGCDRRDGEPARAGADDTQIGSDLALGRSALPPPSGTRDCAAPVFASVA